MSAVSESRVGHTMFSALSITVACTLPLLLIGGLAVQLQADLAFSVVALGGAIAVYRGAGVVFAIPLGRLVDRLGSATSMRVAAGLVVVSCLGIAVTADRWTWLAAWLVLAGISNVVGQGGANVALTRAVPSGRQGIAFGLKQSALPVSGALAGLAVPVFALTVGWRWSFVVTAAAALAAGLTVPKVSEAARAKAGRAANRTEGTRPFLLLAIALFFGMGAASTLSAFTVVSAVDGGIDVGRAGLLLTVGSIAAILVRLIIGALADRRGGRHLPVVAALLFVGSVGYLLMAIPGPWWMVAGVILAFGSGWGFNGLFWFSVIRLNEATPGRATGLVMPGGSLGGMVGPLIFGGIVSRTTYAHAWAMAAAWAVLAGVFVVLARRHIMRDAPTKGERRPRAPRSMMTPNPPGGLP